MNPPLILIGLSFVLFMLFSYLRLCLRRKQVDLLSFFEKIRFPFAFKESFASLGLVSKKAWLASLPFEEKRKRRKEEAKKKGRAIDKADDTICQQFLRAIFYYI